MTLPSISIWYSLSPLAFMSLAAATKAWLKSIPTTSSNVRVSSNDAPPTAQPTSRADLRLWVPSGL